MTDDSYHNIMPICIGIGIRISVSKIFSSVVGIKSIGKSGISPPLPRFASYAYSTRHLLMQNLELQKHTIMSGFCRSICSLAMHHVNKFPYSLPIIIPASPVFRRWEVVGVSLQLIMNKRTITQTLTLSTYCYLPINKHLLKQAFFIV